MQISRMLDNSKTRTIEGSGKAAGIADFCIKGDYSLSVFKDNHRKIENFLSADAIGLDFDKGMSLDEAKTAFAEYKHVIIPSKSHQKDKHGVVCDRFRVILFMSSPITDVPTFYATWESLAKKYPACDSQCKDPSRMFYASVSIASVKEDGTLIDPVRDQTPDNFENAQNDTVRDQKKGILNARTCRFLIQGAPAGERHGELIQAAYNFKQNGFSKDELIERLNFMIKSGGSWAHPKLVAEDLKKIDDIFDNRNPKYPAEIKPPTFNFAPIGEVMKKDTKYDWVINGLVPTGGLTLIVGAPKIGKSTIVRQAIRSVCRGEKFLGHSCKPGSVLYLALEEHEALMKQDFVRLGITANDPIMLHIGSFEGQTPVPELGEIVAQTKPTMVVVDPLFLLLEKTDSQSYNSTTLAVKELRNIARTTGAAVVVIHHAKKASKEAPPDPFDLILGSTGIRSATDSNVVIEADGLNRKFSSEGRGSRFYRRRQIIFDENLGTYTLGPETEEF